MYGFCVKDTVELLLELLLANLQTRHFRMSYNAPNLPCLKHDTYMLHRLDHSLKIQYWFYEEYSSPIVASIFLEWYMSNNQISDPPEEKSLLETWTVCRPLISDTLKSVGVAIVHCCVKVYEMLNQV